MSNGTTTSPTAPAPATATAPAKEAKREVRIQFLCEKRQVDRREEVPSGLIGQDAARSPHMAPMFERTMRPIVMKHAAEALEACEDKCSSKGCEREATTIVATPMSVSCISLCCAVLLSPSTPPSPALLACYRCCTAQHARGVRERECGWCGRRRRWWWWWLGE